MISQFSMPERLMSSVGIIFDQIVNCFCISEFFFRDTIFLQSTADVFFNQFASGFPLGS